MSIKIDVSLARLNLTSPTPMSGSLSSPSTSGSISSTTPMSGSVFSPTMSDISSPTPMSGSRSMSGSDYTSIFMRSSPVQTESNTIDRRQNAISQPTVKLISEYDHDDYTISRFDLGDKPGMFSISDGKTLTPIKMSYIKNPNNPCLKDLYPSNEFFSAEHSLKLTQPKDEAASPRFYTRSAGTDFFIYSNSADNSLDIIRLKKTTLVVKRIAIGDPHHFAPNPRLASKIELVLLALQPDVKEKRGPGVFKDSSEMKEAVEKRK